MASNPEIIKPSLPWPKKKSPFQAELTETSKQKFYCKMRTAFKQCFCPATMQSLGEKALIEGFQMVSHGLPRALKNEGRRKPSSPQLKGTDTLVLRSQWPAALLQTGAPYTNQGLRMDWERTFPYFLWHTLTHEEAKQLRLNRKAFRARQSLAQSTSRLPSLPHSASTHLSTELRNNTAPSWRTFCCSQTNNPQELWIYIQ